MKCLHDGLGLPMYLLFLNQSGEAKLCRGHHIYNDISHLLLTCATYPVRVSGGGVDDIDSIRAHTGTW